MKETGPFQTDIADSDPVVTTLVEENYVYLGLADLSSWDTY